MKSIRRHRSGITILEVMFAIGVILIGLLGLASLIPVAARYAGDTIRLDEAIQAGASAGSLAQSQKIADFSRLVIHCDDPSDRAAFPIPSTRLFQRRMVGAARLGLPSNGTHLPASGGQLPASPKPGEIDSPGFARTIGTARLIDRFAGFCIDPAGILENVQVSTASAYRYGVFPYYKPDWNPLSSPNSPGTLTAPLPRLWRCSMIRDIGGVPLSDLDVGPNIGNTRNEIYDRKSAEQIFTLAGNPASLRLKDRTLPVVRAFEMHSASTAASPIPASAANNSRFNWFATLTPGVDGGGVYTLSTVMVEGRVPELLSDATATNRAEDNPNGERLAMVYDSIGFDGGSGGDINIVATADVLDKVRPGQWVMLSRQDYTTIAPIVPRGPSQHAWYRIISASESVIPEGNQQTFPFNVGAMDASTFPTTGGATLPLWSRRLTLDGPDWRFNQFTPNVYGDDFTPDDTVCTIVEGAVEVIQTQVVL